MSPNPFEIISQYTRADALEDGELVDASTLAREYGFRFPVALTRAAWNDAVAWDRSNGAHQDETGRLWDVLSVLRFRIRETGSTDGIRFAVLRMPNAPGSRRPSHCQLVAVCGPGDMGEPVITIMLPGED